jgi:hypothetical protein
MLNAAEPGRWALFRTLFKMMIPALQFVAILCVAISMAGGWAHLLELPRKMSLSRSDYLTVQQIYRGWALLGIAVVGALASTGALAWLQHGQGAPFYYVMAAALCVLLSLVVFFTVTLPANKATRNWTVLPDSWENLRRRWEYSHATGAILYFLALALLILSVLSGGRDM